MHPCRVKIQASVWILGQTTILVIAQEQDMKGKTAQQVRN